MKLLSWNIQWGRGMDGQVDLARILHTIHQLGDFDVICLQEVAVNFPGLPGNRGEDQVAELSAGLPGYTAIYGVDNGDILRAGRLRATAANERDTNPNDPPWAEIEAALTEGYIALITGIMQGNT